MLTLRNPRQHKLFKLGQSGGLSGMLAGRNGTEAIVRISPTSRALGIAGGGGTTQSAGIDRPPHFCRSVTDTHSGFRHCYCRYAGGRQLC